MRIVLLVEGRTEQAFIPHLRTFLSNRLSGNMPSLKVNPFHGALPTQDKLARIVANYLEVSNPITDHVIALTDVYPAFIDAEDAKIKMNKWVGASERFHPHVALHDFEAWLIPFWPTILQLAKINRKRPTSKPETINHDKPPSYRLKELFEIGECRDSYNKPRHGNRILRNKDLSIAIQQCPELKALVNSILTLCGADPVP